MHAILVGCGMHTLGILLWIVAWSVVTICYCTKDVVVAAPGWVTAGKAAAIASIEVLGY